MIDIEIKKITKDETQIKEQAWDLYNEINSKYKPSYIENAIEFVKDIILDRELCVVSYDYTMPITYEADKVQEKLQTFSQEKAQEILDKSEGVEIDDELKPAVQDYLSRHITMITNDEMTRVNDRMGAFLYFHVSTLDEFAEKCVNEDNVKNHDDLLEYMSEHLDRDLAEVHLDIALSDKLWESADFTTKVAEINEEKDIEEER